MIPKKKRKRNSNIGQSQKVGLSYRSYLKNRQVGRNINYDLIDIGNGKTDHQVFEYSIGGSWCRIQDAAIDPYTTEDEDKYKDRPKRGSISYFSHKSRSRLLELISKLDKSKCDPNSVLFITLTSPAVGWRDVPGEKWKKRLNNFNTQLRQKFGKDSNFCGIWRLEFQERGAPHFHLVTYNVPYIDHQWVSNKWNKICSVGLSFKEKQKHRQAATQVEIAREWGNINDYFSKTMAYIGKDEGWKNTPTLPNGKPDEQLLDWMKQFGRHWGVICRDNLKKMTEIVVGEFETKEQYHKVRRVFRKYIQSTRRRKLKGNYNSKIGKMLDKIFSQKSKSKHKVFIPDKVFEQLLLWVGLDVTSFDCNLQSVTPDRN